MNTVNRLAGLIADAPRDYPPAALRSARHALIDTVACMYAGSQSSVAVNALAAVSRWGSGNAPVIGHNMRLAAPFAALVNGAAAHAHDYDDFDEPANSHPSAVIYPALLALAADGESSGADLLDAHIIGVEIMQRLGEAMNMEHYRRGWLSTLTLGSLGAAGACARFAGFNRATAGAALSLAASMASGLTNQGGFQAKQLHPGLGAKNGVLAAALATSGITASTEVIDGPISLARVMGSYDAQKFEAAQDKLANPWSIVEHGLISKSFPTCGYTHRVIEAAFELHAQLPNGTGDVTSIRISVPDYYLDLLVYPRPRTAAQAMFSAEYNVAAALQRGRFGFDELSEEALADAELQRLVDCSEVVARVPRDRDIVYDPFDPDWVEIRFADGRKQYGEITLPTGMPAKPMSEAARCAAARSRGARIAVGPIKRGRILPQPATRPVMVSYQGAMALAI